MARMMIGKLTAAALLLAARSFAQVLVVPPDTPGHVAAQPYDTWENAAVDIQTAVSFAESGNHSAVWVSNGFYRLPGTVTVSKGIRLRSFGDGSMDRGAVVDGDGLYQGFYLNHPDIIFEGFTVTNCVIRGSEYGAAVYMNSGGLVRNCRFSRNTQLADPKPTNFRGGAVGMRDGVVVDCEFDNNTMLERGGGINLISGDMLVSNCTFRGNFATKFGGGACITGGSALIVDSLFINNHSERGGGYNTANLSSITLATSVVDRCVFVGNTITNYGVSGSSGQGGGAVQLSSATVYSIVRNSLLLDNRSLSYYGGGLSIFTSVTGVVENCTIVGNQSYSDGGGLHVAKVDPAVVFRNNIIHGNLGGAPINYNVSTYAQRLFWTNNFVVTSFNLPGSGNIFAGDPNFVDPMAGNWHLKQPSPCINTGETLAHMLSSSDLDGGKRVRYGAVDMGCYEARLITGTVIIVR